MEEKVVRPVLYLLALFFLFPGVRNLDAQERGFGGFRGSSGLLEEGWRTSLYEKTRSAWILVRCPYGHSCPTIFVIDLAEKIDEEWEKIDEECPFKTWEVKVPFENCNSPYRVASHLSSNSILSFPVLSSLRYDHAKFDGQCPDDMAVVGFSFDNGIVRNDRGLMRPTGAGSDFPRGAAIGVVGKAWQTLVYDWLHGGNTQGLVREILSKMLVN
jgi:hypothetical protein